MVYVTLCKNARKANGYALVDSGADMSLAHISYARQLNLASSRITTIRGIGAENVPCMIAEIVLSIDGIPGEIVVPFGFVDSASVEVVLGRGKFFDTHDVLFRVSKEFNGRSLK